MFAERTMETGASSGTSVLTLGTSVSGWKTWRSQLADTSPVFYFAEISDGSIWEAGYGTLTYGTPDTITGRTLLLSSTGSLVDFASATVYVMSVPNAAAFKHVLNPINNTRPAWLQAGGTWRDYTLGLATTWVEKIATSGAAGGDIETGRLEVVPGIYVPSPRSYWVDNGAANLTMTTAHIGRVIKFNVTAAVRTYTLLAGATAGIGHGFTVGIYPYGSENAVGLVPNGSEVIDGGTAAATMYVPAGRITWLRWDGVSLQWRTDLANSPVAFPGGRLTLETGVPVSSTDQAGKATIYYSPIGGNGMFPFRCGAGFAMFPLTSQLSNDTTASSSGAGPAALGSYQCVDVYGWLNAGVPTLTRSAKWMLTATVTMTIAAPGVVTHTAHGLWDGATVLFSTTGALPTGITAGVNYFITKVDANSYKLSTSLANQIAGTFITTTGSQSGVHTVNNYTSVRGTGAGTPELAVVNGIYVNAVAITNGPGVGQGTYIGTIYGNVSAQVDLKFGSYAAGFGEAFVGIWNLYNRVNISGTINTSTASWGCTGGGVQKVFNSSATARASMVSGLKQDGAKGNSTAYITCDAATNIYVGMAFRSIQWTYASVSMYVNNGSGASPSPLDIQLTAPPFLGLGYFVPIDTCINYTSSYVNNNSAAYMNYDWRY